MERGWRSSNWMVRDLRCWSLSDWAQDLKCGKTGEFSVAVSPTDRWQPESCARAAACLKVVAFFLFFIVSNGYRCPSAGLIHDKRQEIMITVFSGL